MPVHSILYTQPLPCFPFPLLLRRFASPLRHLTCYSSRSQSARKQHRRSVDASICSGRVRSFCLRMQALASGSIFSPARVRMRMCMCRLRISARTPAEFNGLPCRLQCAPRVESAISGHACSLRPAGARERVHIRELRILGENRRLVPARAACRLLCAPHFTMFAGRVSSNFSPGLHRRRRTPFKAPRPVRIPDPPHPNSNSAPFH
ncbi:hypothetical protein C8F04DRAFT_271218 [Mycena alexandri]|uniref:Uncharacterized protein n=1 Tax=Mycena alexandri TaxID=1745969 RepID=A0AAD6S4W4_9AGAR|nr:hypothetical protein C8F04DRAFT_271218 [Mycena alexandri]